MTVQSVFDVLLQVLETAPPKDSPTEPAPWWGVPVIAGGFLILGGLLAFTSTWLSDRRKLRREDRRQWDKVLLETYLRIVELLPELRQTRWLQEGEAIMRRHSEMEKAQAELENFGHTVSLVADNQLLASFRALCDVTRVPVARAHDGLGIRAAENRAIGNAHSEFEGEVRRGLRITKHKP